MTHDEGVVGTCRSEEEQDGGACRFYINLRSAKYLDGQYTVFGKVTQGMDIARKILSLPVRTDGEYPEGDRPVKPMVMKKVTITVSGAGSGCFEIVGSPWSVVSGSSTLTADSTSAT